MARPRIAPDTAVALDYRRGGPLPQVTAKGRGAIAAQIVRIAEAEGIPVREDADLAGLLHKLDIGSPIPTAAFAAVAEILAFLYRSNAAAGGEEKQHDA